MLCKNTWGIAQKQHVLIRTRFGSRAQEVDRVVAHVGTEDFILFVQDNLHLRFALGHGMIHTKFFLSLNDGENLQPMNQFFTRDGEVP